MRKKIIIQTAVIFIFIAFFITISIIQFEITKQMVFPYNAFDLDEHNSLISNSSPSALLSRTPTVEISFDYATPVYWRQINSFSYSLNASINGELISFSWSDATFRVYKVLGVLRDLPNGYYELKVYANYDNGTSNEINRRNFVVDTNFVEPTLEVISPINQTIYHTQEVELSYTSNKEVMMSYYELDKGLNTNDWTYFKGNITLTGLSEGSHKLILFVQTEVDFLLPQSTPYYFVNFKIDPTKQP
jgi:hypothetical protein